MKKEFFNYIGPADSLHTYVRSYKLVLLKCFFKLMDSSGCALAYDVAKQFKDFYVSRINAGKIPDTQVEARIENITQSSVQDVYNVIITNPFKYINENGFLLKRTTADGKEQFYLPPQLVQELSGNDIQHLKSTIEDKLALYYSKIDNTKHGSNMKEFVERFIAEYVTSKKETFAGHSFGNYIRNTVPKLLYDTGLVDEEKYLITGSVGQGNWAMVPWICVFDRKITTTATKGVYIVYLLSKDGNTLYLTLNQGCTEISQQHSKRETIQIMRKKAEEIIAKVDNRGFFSDQNVSLGEGLTQLAEFYEKGIILYKAYNKGSVPDENELQMDLKNMIDVYKEYVTGKGEKKMKVREQITAIEAYIAAQGFKYDGNLVKNFYLSLKSKPFVILAGTSGTGKTRLVRLFAEAIKAEYSLISVRPDWSDSSDLFGHVDLNQKFVKGDIIDFVKSAEINPTKPYILCLDEMNLARVEYYMSDILSTIETRRFEAGQIVTDTVVPTSIYGNDTTAVGKYGKVILPGNLYIVGTVNMDETTFPFSKKVLDRANTIEFSYVDLLAMPSFERTSVSAQTLTNDFLVSEYITLNDCDAADRDYIESVCTKLQRINNILEKANAHIGYRVRDEIVFYMLNNKKATLLEENIAFDNQIMQKILPRIQGSSEAIKDMLGELVKVCESEKYETSTKKINFMIKRYEEDGFTSYWL